MKLKHVLSTVAAASLLAACATPEVVEVHKAGDNQLSCQQIAEQIREAEKFEKAARDERKVTSKNVAAAVFFWPALIGTYANTEEAINAAKERKAKMTKLFESKNCPSSLLD